MVMRPTRATPIMRADAVADVRFGLRLAFSRARRPVVPETAWTGAPSTCMSGRAMTGPSTNTPMIVATVPNPIRASAVPDPRIPAVNDATPSPRTVMPITVRFADDAGHVDGDVAEGGDRLHPARPHRRQQGRRRR